MEYNTNIINRHKVKLQLANTYQVTIKQVMGGWGNNKQRRNDTAAMLPARPKSATQSRHAHGNHKHRAEAGGRPQAWARSQLSVGDGNGRLVPRKALVRDARQLRTGWLAGVFWTRPGTDGVLERYIGLAAAIANPGA